MLVCNVSMRPPRSAIAADLAETAAAQDALGTGNVVFATLVDDPASVGEIVDAYLGEIMREAASAADAADASIPATYIATIAETMTANDFVDWVASLPDTWNPADTSANMTLSNGNLTATSTNFSVGTRAKYGRSSGKYYWEVTMANGGSTADGTGIATASASLTSTVLGTGTAGVIPGFLYVNGSSVGSFSGMSNGCIIGIAVDLTAQLIWIRVAPSGNWNNSGTANPATGVGGVSISTLGAVALFPLFQVGSAVGHNATANFGASTFSGAVPSGFTPGWV